MLMEAATLCETDRPGHDLETGHIGIRLLVENVLDYAILLLDLEGHVLTWNKGAEILKGYRSNEIVGKHFSIFYPPDEIEAGKPARELQEAKENGRLEDEGWRVRKDGSQFWANVVITALRDGTGQLRGFGKVTRDFTKRKEAEQRLLERTAQLETANKDLDSFSYSVSHDLRAPLRAIRDFSRIVLEEHAESMDSQGKGYLQMVQDNSLHMMQMVEDLLGFARFGRQAITKLTVEPNKMVRQCLAELIAEQHGRQVEIVIDDLPLCEADPALLKHVWTNLLSNALKYTRKQEHARIEIGWRSEPRVAAEGQSASPERAGIESVYFVKDNGAGFNMKGAPKLFGVFQRLHRAADFEGTGVGLAIVQRIVQRHGGRIWADAAVNQGAMFSFSLN